LREPVNFNFVGRAKKKRGGGEILFAVEKRLAGKLQERIKSCWERKT